MPIIALLLAASLPSHAAVPPCRAAQLRLSADDHDGGYNGMSHSGTELSLRNTGRGCRLPRMPRIEMRSAAGRIVAVSERTRDTHSIDLGQGRRASIELRWTSNQVFDHNVTVEARSVAVRVGAGSVRTAIEAQLVGERGAGIGFSQTPARVAEGMPAG